MAKRSLSIILELDDHPQFHKVLQCPVAVSASSFRLILLVSSRDGRNRSFSALVEISNWAVEPRQSKVISILPPSELFRGCLGLMATDIVFSEDKASVVGMAFEDSGGVFHSKLFFFEASAASPLTPLPGTLRFMGENTNGPERFRTTPSFVKGLGNDSVLYSSSEPYGPEAVLNFGFPETYGIFFSKNMDVLDDTQLIWDNPGADALASPRMDLAGSLIRYSKRPAKTHRTSYDFCQVNLLYPRNEFATPVMGDSEVVLRNQVSYSSSFELDDSDFFLGSVGCWGSKGVQMWRSAVSTGVVSAD